MRTVRIAIAVMLCTLMYIPLVQGQEPPTSNTPPTLPPTDGESGAGESGAGDTDDPVPDEATDIVRGGEAASPPDAKSGEEPGAKGSEDEFDALIEKGKRQRGEASGQVQRITALRDQWRTEFLLTMGFNAVGLDSPEFAQDSLLYDSYVMENLAGLVLELGFQWRRAISERLAIKIAFLIPLMYESVDDAFLFNTYEGNVFNAIPNLGVGLRIRPVSLTSPWYIDVHASFGAVIQLGMFSITNTSTEGFTRDETVFAGPNLAIHPWLATGFTLGDEEQHNIFLKVGGWIVPERGGGGGAQFGYGITF